MILRRVDLRENAYDIYIREGLIGDFGILLGERFGAKAARKAALVTDGNVWERYAAPMTASLARAGLAFEALVLAPGEENKSLAGLSRLYDAFADMRLRRDDLILAFGGGVIGDLAGFAAATWMRGVRLAQIPTTLLAQVDSSVGGKTAVNTRAGKNLVGAFYQPSIVLTDTALLASLPARELRCGMAEVIKYGAVRSRRLFESLRTVPGPAALRDMIGECCAIKADIVERDAFDTGERMLLNFGHSFGHAIERLGDFRRHNHGEAVAMGMVLAATVGERMGLTAPGSADALRALLAVHGLEDACPYTPAELLPQMMPDKKNSDGALRLVLLAAPGEAFVRSVDPDALRAAMKGGV
ncbi:MAG: 3-dehydroquinate synthase [Clostridiales Family XIII bacterium]|jgi:3-dehydroquinate synthase|nr:3-dehydroquinate synthase [Clostridiales Family XIII bacterium]